METQDISRRKVGVSTALSVVLSFIFGINFTVLACAKEFFTQSDRMNPHLTEDEWASVSSIICIGALVSLLIAPYIRLRKKASFVGINIFYALGTALTMFGRTYRVLFAARVLSGIGVGLTSVYVPRYVESISPIRIRGMLGGMHQLCIASGVLAGQLLSFFFHAPDTWWISYCVVLALITIHLLAIMLTDNADLAEQGIQQKQLSGLLGNRKALLSMITGAVLHCGQQASGINGIILYSDDIFKELGSERLYTVCVGLINILVTAVSTLLVDECGREMLLLVSMLVEIVALFSMSIFDKSLLVLPILVFIAGYSIGMGPIVWFISAEIYPEEYKAAGTALAAGFNWTVSYLVSRYFPKLLKEYDTLIFSFFAFFLIGTFIYVLLFFSETKGKKPDFQKLE